MAVNTMTIVVELFQDIFAASKIKPLTRPDGSRDLRAVDEYDEFVMNVLSIFDYNDFEIIEEHESPYSDSCYFTLVKKDDFKNQDYKYILFVRISDHENRRSTRRQRNKYFANKAYDMRKPDTKSKQIWKLKEITVDGLSFQSYDEALDEVAKRLK